MRVVKGELENFASYKQLTFDYTDKGLTLIHGPTGSGKSTLCDAAPWVLFGKTAKNGAVDEVLSWPGTEVTRGTLYLDSGLIVTRSRGPKSKDNDLYFKTADSTPTRGKDLADTQRLLNAQLGIDSELYLSGAYFHEFSSTAAFFTTTPQNRRAACEQIVDLTMAKTLQLELKASKKDAKAALTKATTAVQIQTDRLEYARRNKQAQEGKLTQWNKNHAVKQKELQALFDNFEQDQAQVVKQLKASEKAHEAQTERTVTELKSQIMGANKSQNLANAALARNTEVCPTCGNSNSDITHDTSHLDKEIARLQKELARPRPNPYTQQLQVELTRVNTYAKQLENLTKEQNPYKDAILEIVAEVDGLEHRLDKAAEEARLCEQSLGDIDLMSDIVTSFRASLVKNTIKGLEETTNALLTNHFDAEIQVAFEITEDVDISITKDGNECVYTQLSKGQRQLLKLCFGVAVMKQVSQHQGIRFHQIFFDEVLSGLDGRMKERAFKLLENLTAEYESVFVVDHALELKSLFPRAYEVALINGHSHIEEQA